MNRSMKPMAKGRPGRATASTCHQRMMSARGEGDADWRVLDRPEIWLSVFEVGSERTARSSVFRVSQPVQHAGAHSRGSAGELAIPHAARRAPESSDPARAAPLRGRTPRTLKYPLPSGICCPSDAGGPDFDRRAEADARNPDPSHSRPQAIQAAKGHIHLKGSSMVSSRAPRSHPRPCGNQSNGSSSHWPSFHSEQQISPQNDKSVDSSQPQLTVTPHSCSRRRTRSRPW